MNRLYFKAINSEKYGPVVLEGEDPSGNMWRVASYHESMKEARAQALVMVKLEDGFQSGGCQKPNFVKAVNL